VTVLIGIAGGTGSGKTSFAVKIRDRVGEDRCVLIAQDAYYKDGSTLSAAAQAAINYDHPDAFDTSLLVQDLRDLRAGRPVPHLTYDHASYARRVLPDPVKPRQVVILEGILVLAMVVYHSMNYAGYESLPRDYMGSCRRHSSCSWDSC